MEKRYQVFVSSTFQDLQIERQAVTRALMAMDCIPSGMELFPAADDDQFRFIKGIIDDCDYYLLILAGRYGSLAKDGVSYTEKEFDYALRRKKPIISFLHVNPQTLPFEKSESDPALRQSLELFRSKARKRLVQLWTTPDELASHVSVSVQKLIRMRPAEGWVRTNSLGDVSNVKAAFAHNDPVKAAFVKGGDAGRLDGTWKVTWFVFDESGHWQVHMIKNPDDPERLIPYPDEYITVRSNESMVLCTSRDALKKEVPYWLGGKLSSKDDLSLLYWNRVNYMAGVLFLTVIEHYPHPLRMSGWWCGHTRDHKTVQGPVEWVKEEKTPT